MVWEETTFGSVTIQLIERKVCNKVKRKYNCSTGENTIFTIGGNTIVRQGRMWPIRKSSAPTRRRHKPTVILAPFLCRNVPVFWGMSETPFLCQNASLFIGFLGEYACLAMSVLFLYEGTYQTCSILHKICHSGNAAQNNCNVFSIL